MDAFQLVVPEVANVGLIFDQIFETELVEDDWLFYRVGGNSQMKQLVWTTEIKISKNVLRRLHPINFTLNNYD